MKHIEGKTLLSIHQYFPTDYLRMAKKSQGMMNLFIENISEKVRKGIMDCNLESSSLEISNQAQPLFTLTAEEVENLKKVAEKFAETYKEGGSTTIFIREPKFNGFFSNLLTRIKQWQDEHKY